MVLTETILLWTAAAIAGVSLVVGTATVVTAGWTWVRDRRRERVRDRLQTELFERLFSSEPAWDVWIGTLSRVERRQLRDLLDTYLRQLRGTEHERLRDLAAALGVGAQAKRDLKSGRQRYRALTWLALLEESIDPAELETHCGDDLRLRAGAARVLYRSDHPDAAVAGTDLLIGDGQRSLTAFGLDTLYRLNNGVETPILETMQTGVESWNQRLLVQTLLVLRYCSIDTSGSQLGWISEMITHESPRVRTAAVGVIERHGWQKQLQDEIDIQTLLSDPEQAVRYDTYLLLSAWNNDRSEVWLHRALEAAGDDDEMLKLVRAALLHSGIELSELPPRFDPFVEWVRADTAVGRRRRVWGVSAAWS